MVVSRADLPARCPRRHLAGKCLTLRRSSPRIRGHARALRYADEADFRRIVLVGGKEVLRAVHGERPQHLHRMVAEKALHLARGGRAANEGSHEPSRQQDRAGLPLGCGASGSRSTRRAQARG